VADITPNFLDLLDSRFKKIFYEAYGEKETVYDKLFGIINSTKAYEKFSHVSGFGTFNYTPELQTIPSEVRVQGYDKELTAVKFAKANTVSTEAIRDDLFNIMDNGMAALGRSARATLEELGVSIFNNAFSTTAVDVCGYSYNPTGPDAVALCDNSHPRSPADASLCDNLQALALTSDNLASAAVLMEQFVDEKGVLINAQPDTLIVPEELRRTAWQIVNSDYEFDAANVMNANYFRGRYDVVVWPYLTSTKDWFLVDSTLMKQFLMWVWRDPLEFTHENVLGVDGQTWRAKFRCSYGFTNWRWIVGNDAP